MPNSRRQTHNDECDDYSDTLRGVLVARYAPLRHAAKVLARLCDTHPNTAANWLRARNLPTGRQLVRLMAADAEVEAVVLAMVRARREQAQVKKVGVLQKHVANTRALAAPSVVVDNVVLYEGPERRRSPRGDRLATARAVTR